MRIYSNAVQLEGAVEVCIESYAVSIYSSSRVIIEETIDGANFFQSGKWNVNSPSESFCLEIFVPTKIRFLFEDILVREFSLTIDINTKPKRVEALVLTELEASTFWELKENNPTMEDSSIMEMI